MRHRYFCASKIRITLSYPHINSYDFAQVAMSKMDGRAVVFSRQCCLDRAKARTVFQLKLKVLIGLIMVEGCFPWHKKIF
jgi:hypothetical protein